MSIATLTAPPAARGQVECQLELELRDSPDAIVRVLVTLRRRRCQIARVDFAEADAHRPGWLRIGLLAPAGAVSSLASWVENVVDVLAVRMSGA